LGFKPGSLNLNTVMINFTRNSKINMLHTIIIDDEKSVRTTLEKLTANYCPNVKLVAEANGVKSGIEAINRHHPDLVLLDIEMDDGTGFDLLKQLEPVDFKVIFITAYNQYAIKAIKFSALDYLLKPVDPDELTEAIGKFEKLLIRELNEQLRTLEDNMKTNDRAKKKIILRTAENIHLVSLNDIVYCQSHDNYTNFYLLNSKHILVSNTLKEFDDMLSESGFFRVHKSYLINLIYIDRFEKAEGGTIVLTDEIRIPVASRKKERMLELLNRIGSGGL